MKRFLRDESGIGIPGLVVLTVLALVGAYFLINAAVSGQRVNLPPAFQAATGGAGAPAGTPVPAAAAAAGQPGSGLTSVADQLAWNSKQTQGMGVAFSPTDKTGSASVTTGGLTFWSPDTQVTGSTGVPIVDNAQAGVTNTLYIVKTASYYKMAYTDPTNTFYPQDLCFGEAGMKPVIGGGTGEITPCQVPVSYNPQIANPVWSLTSMNLRRIGAMVDPNDESSVTDARGINQWNGQSNITNPDGGNQNVARCLVSTTNAAGSRITNAGNLGAPTNGNVVFWNNTACSNFYVESLVECSTTSLRWCNMPVIHPKWSQNNGTGGEYTTVTLTVPQPGWTGITSGDVTTAFNSQLAIPLYSTASPFQPSATINYIRVTYTPNAANFGAGKCTTVNFDDNGANLAGLVNATLTGGAASSYQICRSA